MAESKPQKEAVYSGVARGPYYEFYIDWMNSEEGRRVQAEEWGVRVEDIKTICPRGQPARRAEEKRQAK